jgi:hypothetical protein
MTKRERVVVGLRMPAELHADMHRLKRALELRGAELRRYRQPYTETEIVCELLARGLASVLEDAGVARHFDALNNVEQPSARAPSASRR